MSSPVHEFLTIDIPASLVLTLKTSPVLLVAGEALYLMNVYNLVVKYVAGTTPFNPTSTDAFAAYTGDGTETGSLLLYPGANYLAKGFVDQAVNHTMYMDAWFGTNGSLTGGLSAAPASPLRAPMAPIPVSVTRTCLPRRCVPSISPTTTTASARASALGCGLDRKNALFATTRKYGRVEQF